MSNNPFADIPDELNEKLVKIIELVDREPLPVDQLTELLFDPEPVVRRKTARIIWEYSHRDFIDPLLEVAAEDPEPAVRARALVTLGKYIHEGEVAEYELDESERMFEGLEEPDQLTVAQYNRIKKFLFATLHNTDRSVKERRNALEALSFSTDDRVEKEIERAFERAATDWKISALFGMGRHKHPKWEQYVKDCIPHEDEAILREAICAAGKLRIEELNQKIIEIARTRVGDIQEEAIVALAEIGSHAGGAFEFLDNLAANSTGEFKEFVESAVTRWLEVNRMLNQPEN